LLNHLNDMLRREKGFRVVVLDWGADDRPCFVGAGEEDEIMFLYKVDERLHLLLHPEKINHVDAHKGFCRRCFFFFCPTTDEKLPMSVGNGHARRLCLKCRDPNPTAVFAVTP